MNKNLQTTINNLPQKPGVYQYFNDKGKRLYIGKAKNLRSRVRSYFAPSASSGQANHNLTPAKQRMVNQISKIEYTITDNEQEALLLETSLIKEHKPPYNVVLKDDKYWQYIQIDYDSYWPQIYTTRRPDFRKKNNSIFFGPYISGLAVKESLRLIKKIFPICLKTPAKKNSKSQPCFNYHLGRCPGPCVGKTTPEEYSKVFEDIKKFLNGSRQQLTNKLKLKMQNYSQSHHYEAAARTRDQIKALKKLESRQKVVTQNQDNIDLISLYRENGKAAINLFKIRQGKLLDKFNTIVKSSDVSDEEIIEAFISQYYTATTDLPKYIITNIKLQLKTFLNIKIQLAQKGKKLQLIKLGSTNAREFLKQQETFFDRSTRLATSRQKALVELKDILKLKTLPRRIETYDISNIQGQLAVGSMVVFFEGKAKKSDYRRFNIRLKQTPDDVHMLQEVLSRRLSYIKKLPVGNPELISGSKQKTKKIPKQVRDDSFIKQPDLIVIDGGKGQLNAAIQILAELNINIPIISLAKKQEEIFIPNHENSLVLKRQSAALQLLQQGRDEAHRFAITAYRQRHKKQSTISSFDEIPGIGAKTKAILLKKYSSPDRIKNINLTELSKLIGQKRAKIIKEHL